jgi:serine protease Do
MLRCVPALLAAMSYTPVFAQQVVGNGTGFLVNKAGWVLTNAHVAEGCDEVVVDRFGAAQSVIVDESADLALLRFEGLGGIEPLGFRERIARLTEDVVVLGYPLTDILGRGLRATTGTVSSLSGVQSDPRYIQISAPVQPGNSGGPVLDEAGNVIGVASAVLSEEAYAASQNVNFALTSQIAIRFLSESGIDFAFADPSLSEDANLDRAQAATFLLLCMSDAALQPDPLPVPEPETTSSEELSSEMTVLEGLDVLGFDYDIIRNVGLEQCERSCQSDKRCKAFTYNVRQSACLLKSDALVLLENDSAVGGFVNYLSGQVIDSGLSVSSNVDSPGGDYRRLRQSSYLECTLECGIDARCAAFAFVLETQDCWLKDHLGTVEPMPGVEFGMRR